MQAGPLRKPWWLATSHRRGQPASIAASRDPDGTTYRSTYGCVVRPRRAWQHRHRQPGRRRRRARNSRTASGRRRDRRRRSRRHACARERRSRGALPVLRGDAVAGRELEHPQHEQHAERPTSRATAGRAVQSSPTQAAVRPPAATRGCCGRAGSAGPRATRQGQRTGTTQPAHDQHTPATTADGALARHAITDGRQRDRAQHEQQRAGSAPDGSSAASRPRSASEPSGRTP